MKETTVLVGKEREETFQDTENRKRENDFREDRGRTRTGK